VTSFWSEQTDEKRRYAAIRALFKAHQREQEGNHEEMSAPQKDKAALAP
jgi:hypothetical protein